VLDKREFAPAAITFYSVIYKLRREGLVKRSSDSFRSTYAITPKGRDELLRAVSFLVEVLKNLGQS
jgi:DNA-binding PadR family transcriptional regulator